MTRERKIGFTKKIAVMLSVLLLTSCKAETPSKVYDFSAEENQDYIFDNYPDIPGETEAKKYLESRYPGMDFEFVKGRKVSEETNYNSLSDPEIIWVFNNSIAGKFNVYLDYSKVIGADYYKTTFATDFQLELINKILPEVTKDFSSEEQSKIIELPKYLDYSVARLGLQFTDTEDMRATINLARKLDQKLKAEYPGFNLRFLFYADKGEIAEDFKVLCGAYDMSQNPDDKVLANEMEYNDLIFSIQSQTGLDKYTKEQIEAAVADTSRDNYQFRYIDLGEMTLENILEYSEDKDKEPDVKFWKDLANNSYGTESIQMATLYRILERSNYPSLEGSVEKFSFTDANNKKYEFSYDFVIKKDAEEQIKIKGEDYTIEQKLKFLGPEFYYKVDGKNVYFNNLNPTFNSITYDEFTVMTSKFLRNLWEEVD